MPDFRVVFEIEIDADSPLEAAIIAEEMVKDGGFQWYVQNVYDDVIYSVDLDQDNDDSDPVIEIDDYSPLIQKP